MIEKKLESAKGVDYKIIYKRYVEGKSLKVVAEELNYNYSWLRNKVAMLGL
jgi:hypothetical protein